MAEFTTIWRNKWLTSEAKTIDDMIAALRSAVQELEEMSQAGICLDPESAVEDDHAMLVTTDAKVAKKFGLEEEETEEEEEDKL